MAQIIVGKLLPNLKVTLSEDEASFENPEDENCDFTDTHSSKAANKDVEIVRSWMSSLQNPKIYKNKGGAFTTGIDLTSEDNAEALDKRAERFGIEKEESVSETISSMYESMGIDIKNRTSVISATVKNIRLDALHIRGVNDLSTNEVFQYFQDYGPASVEWINDFSCNVVWLDESSCARALLGMSKPLKNSKPSAEEEIVNSDSSDQSRSSSSPEDTPTPEKVETATKTTSSELQVEVSMDVDEDDSPTKSGSNEVAASLDIPVPPGCWRLGVPHPKAKTILLRFAMKDDRKLPGAEKRSIYYKKYGNPNYGGLRGLISASRKRRIQAATNKRAIELGTNKSRSSQSDGEDLEDIPSQRNTHPKPPRMRMYADDEELKTRNSRYKEGSREKRSVHSRLGMKYTKDDLCHLGSYHRESERDSFNDRDDDYRDYRRNNRYSTSTDTVSNWSRKRNLPSQNQGDLRSKLRKLKTEDSVTKHRSPLCVDEDFSSDS